MSSPLRKTDDEVYDRLADALGVLPNGFPRTPSNVEIPLLKKIFSPEDAWLAGWLCGEMEPLDKVSERVGLSKKETGERLMKFPF